MTWPCMEKSELVRRLDELGPDRLVRVLLFERLGDAAARAEGVWVLIAQGDQNGGIGVLMSDVFSLDGEPPRRGDLVEYRTIDAEQHPYVVLWVDGGGN